MGNEEKPLFLPEEQEIIRRAEKKNILEKLKAGKTLSVAERSFALGDQPEPKAKEKARYAKNQTELADALGVDRKTVQRWRKQKGFPPPLPNGRWDIDATERWRDGKTEQKESRTESDGRSKSEGEARKVWLQVEKLKHELEATRGRYVDLEDARSEVEGMVRLCRSQLLSIGNRVGPLVAGMTAAEAAKRIDEEIVHALEQIRADKIKPTTGEEEGEE